MNSCPEDREGFTQHSNIADSDGVTRRETDLSGRDEVPGTGPGTNCGKRDRGRFSKAKPGDEHISLKDVGLRCLLTLCAERTCVPW